jgi:hypothetical protein
MCSSPTGSHPRLDGRACARDDRTWVGVAVDLEEGCRLQAAGHGLKELLSLRILQATTVEAGRWRLVEVVRRT